MTFVALSSDVKSSRTSWPRGQNFVLGLGLGLEHSFSACPRTFYFGLVKMGVMIELVIIVSLQWLSIKVVLHLHSTSLRPLFSHVFCVPTSSVPAVRKFIQWGRIFSQVSLNIPATRTLRYGPRSFAMAGPSTWNSLPAPLRSCHLTSTFRRDLKTELFARTYH